MEGDLIKSIDFKLLKEQKKLLLQAIEDEDNVQRREAMEGIICLLNFIQDAAVDEYGYNEDDVFHFEDIEVEGQ